MHMVHEVVRLRHDHPTERLAAGTTGTVVYVVAGSPRRCVVEVADGRGRTRALLTVLDDEIEAAGETVPGLTASG